MKQLNILSLVVLLSLPLLLIFSCGKESSIRDYYVVTQTTPLYQHVTLSGSYRQSIEAGTEIRVEETFGKCVSIDFHGHTRYIDIRHVKKLDVPIEEKTVTETSQLPPRVQQILFEYANYRQWPFWAITLGALVIAALGTLGAIRLENSIADYKDYYFEKCDRFYLWTFLVGFILGVWYFFAPESTEGILYRLDFIRLPLNGEGNKTVWFIFILCCTLALFNLSTLLRSLKRYGISGIVVYGYNTIFGAMTLLLSLYVASASMIILIIVAIAYFAMGALEGLATAGSASMPQLSQAERDKRYKDRNDRARKEASNLEHYHRTSKMRDPNQWK